MKTSVVCNNQICGNTIKKAAECPVAGQRHAAVKVLVSNTGCGVQEFSKLTAETQQPVDRMQHKATGCLVLSEAIYYPGHPRMNKVCTRLLVLSPHHYVCLCYLVI